ncbi:MAG: hypothetical protein KBF37_04930 [Saprospiraceae bacterium]|jgi:hypothetical protein|nr:hypothetical protein [Saprospiraceae bacterium]MBP9209652.1 hypothetical protein [Saprospiraceae bacterium]MBV6471987.1 hypothetical protein [Saprospiraceae bacterium]
MDPFTKNESNRSSGLLLLGFVLFVCGSLSLILSMVGVELVVFKWIEVLSFPFNLITKLAILLSGLVLAYLGSMDREQQ